jgi:hypothetical protein
MDITNRKQKDPPASSEARFGAYFADLVLYLSLMFLIREVYFPSVGFIINGLFWSLTTLACATWRMKARGISWADLGLCRPKNIKTTAIATLSILGLAVGSIVVFQIISEQLQPGIAPDTSNESAVHKFGDLKGNWTSFFAIIPLIWLESFLEEVLDRGFLMNWIERMLSSNVVATVLAVVLQAMIFGFRHSQDLSERSITVGLIGLAMGIGYVAFGRNLWPLIIAHCGLNTMSMIDRVQ